MRYALFLASLFLVISFLVSSFAEVILSSDRATLAHREGSPKDFRSMINGTPIRVKRNDRSVLQLRNPQADIDQQFVEFSMEDVLEMALAGMDADYESNMFLKYFKQQDASFVKQCFENILGPPNEEDEYSGNLMIYDRTKLMLLRSPIDRQFGIYDRCDHPLKTAYTQSDGERFGPSPHAFTNTENAPIVFCDSTMQLLTPLLDRDCDTVGDHVNQNGMVPTGYFMFHEFFHWTALVNPGGQRLVDRIGDLWGTADDSPISPYGPYDVMVLNQRKTATLNADNFAWFALEAFYTKYCGRDYLPADVSESHNTHSTG